MRLLLLVQALSHRTLVMLMGADPAKSQVELVSAAEPHVAFAYLKHLWHSDKKVSDFGSIQTNSNDLWRSSGKRVSKNIHKVPLSFEYKCLVSHMQLLEGDLDEYW